MRFTNLVLTALFVFFIVGCSEDGFCDKGHIITNSPFDDSENQPIASGLDGGVVQIRVLFHGVEALGGRTAVLYLYDNDIHEGTSVKIISDSGLPQPHSAVISGKITTAPCTNYGSVFNLYWSIFELKFREPVAATAFVEEIDSYFTH